MTPPALKRLGLLSVVALGVAIALIYGRTVGFGFLPGDDLENVPKNALFHSLSFSNFAHLWTEPYLGLYIPVTLSAWFGLLRLGDVVSPAAFHPNLLHAANLLVHWLNAVLVFTLFRRLLIMRGEAPQGASWAALAGATLFAIHPQQAPVVAWITGMKDLLAAALSLCALHLTLSAEPWLGLEGGAPLLKFRSFRKYILATLFFVSALLAKPNTVCLPLLAAVVSAVAGRSWRHTLAALSPWLLIGLGLALFTIDAQPAQRFEFAIPLGLRPVGALDLLTYYVWKFVIPYPVIQETEWHVVSRVQLPTFWLGVAAMGGALGLAWRERRRAPLACAGLLFALLALAPTLGFVTQHHQHGSDVATQYMYFPMVGVGLILAAVVRRVRARAYSRGAALVGGVVALVLAAISFTDSGAYRDTETFSARVLAHEPENRAALLNLGVSRYLEGRFDEAIAPLAASYRLNPTLDLCRHLANALFMVGRTSEGLALFEAVLQERPDDPVLLSEHGHLLILAGRVDEGVHEARRAATLDSRFASGMYKNGEWLAAALPSRVQVRRWLSEAHAKAPELRSVVWMLSALDRPLSAPQ